MHPAVENQLGALDLFRSVLVAVGPADLGRPTPCGTWRVRELLAHELGQDTAFTVALAGGASELAPWAPKPVGNDVPGPSLAALAEQRAALDGYGDPGGRVIWMPEILPNTPLPAERALGARLIDLVVHAWDLAVGIGAPLQVPDALTEPCLRIARAIPDTDQTRGAGRAFARGLDVPADSAPFDEVLRLLGRDPRWAPPA